MALRWKKNPAPTGLARIGAGPRGSTLRDGDVEFASTYYSKRDARKKEGWYWVTRHSDRYAIPRVNTCDSLLPDEDAAKAAAMAYIKENLDRLEKEKRSAAAVASPVTPVVAVEIPDVLREFVEAIADGFTDCHHQTQECFCAHCGASMDNREPHKPDCMMMRARALLGRKDE